MQRQRILELESTVASMSRSASAAQSEIDELRRQATAEEAAHVKARIEWGAERVQWQRTELALQRKAEAVGASAHSEHEAAEVEELRRELGAARERAAKLESESSTTQQQLDSEAEQRRRSDVLQQSAERRLHESEARHRKELKELEQQASEQQLQEQAAQRGAAAAQREQLRKAWAKLEKADSKCSALLCEVAASPSSSLSSSTASLRSPPIMMNMRH